MAVTARSSSGRPLSHSIHAVTLLQLQHVSRSPRYRGKSSVSASLLEYLTERRLFDEIGCAERNSRRGRGLTALRRSAGSHRPAVVGDLDDYGALNVLPTVWL